MMPLPLRAGLTGSGPAVFSAARMDELFLFPITVGGDGLRERSYEAPDRARVCQRIGEGLRRLRAERQQLVVLLIDLGLGDDDGLLDEVVARLAAATRTTDTVTRLAPGRIVMAAEGVSCGVPALVDVLRDRCERVFARPVCRGGTRYIVHPRVGAAVAVAGAAVTAERLLAQAEAAMPADVASSGNGPGAR
jgi:GGDEF domain-containing protein